MEFTPYDVALITNDKERLYFLGFYSTDGYVVISKKRISFVVDSRYIYAAKKLEKKGINVVLGSDLTFFKEECEREKAKTVGIDFNTTTVAEYERLKKTKYKFVDISEELKSMAEVKSAEELKNIRKACDIAEKAWLDTLPSIKEGITESYLASVLEFNFKKLGASGTSFDTIIAFGENASVPHHETGDTKLKKNTCILMDFGCLYKGYCSDMTRTMFFGQPDDEFLKVYGAVLSAHKKAGANIKAGMTGKEADKIARDELEKFGYGKYFTHSLGHGIGVHIHEFPNLSPRSEAVLKDNEVFSNEPGVYLDGKLGVRIEDSCYLKNGKCKSFMKDDKSLVIIGLDGKIKRKKF